MENNFMSLSYPDKFLAVLNEMTELWILLWHSLFNGSIVLPMEDYPSKMKDNISYIHTFPINN